MLAKANRITTADDYKGVVRRGRRYVTPHLVTYVRSGPEVQTSGARGARFGFIVAKTVGGAVQRNRVRRRLKAASSELLDQVHPGIDVVIRALPGSSDASWETMRSELATSLARSANPGAARRRENVS
ncbi:ribonuclease P protein component [Microterricola pindariensis]|uniref:Ribonuclease P protein component n=1 Tax=Microterricola pindariensis TaxID=478010 RepID=A0ABX5AY31_9MICO|nr:ribonuclease P protein component [Microterricola pindariensis]PPL19833.1 ribonuclease P protein component [Microterricola pindariensis]